MKLFLKRKNFGQKLNIQIFVTSCYVGMYLIIILDVLLVHKQTAFLYAALTLFYKATIVEYLDTYWTARTIPRSVSFIGVTQVNIFNFSQQIYHRC